MITQVLLGVLALIQQMLPLLGSGTAASGVIVNIVDQLQKWMPLIIEEVDVLYLPVKNIIAALSANPATLEEQLTALQQMDAKVDTEFEAAAKEVDPDI